jgi:hypothetical protein
MTGIGEQHVLAVNDLPPEVIQSLGAVENGPAGDLVGAISKSARRDGCITNLVRVPYRPERLFFVPIYGASIAHIWR